MSSKTQLHSINSVLKTLLTLRQMEYLIINQDWTLLEISVGADRFAWSPLQLGTDCRLGFPELTDFEAQLMPITPTSELEIKAIARTLPNQDSLYFDLTVLADCEVSPVRLMILLEDGTQRVVTHAMAEASPAQISPVSSRLHTEHAIGRILATANNLEESTPKILQALCENLGWDVGELWLHNSNQEDLHCIATWHVPCLDMLPLQSLISPMQVKHKQGLPGHAYETGEPIWLSDMTQEQGLLQVPIAVAGGLRSAIAVPIPKPEPLGVLVFFSRQSLSHPSHLPHPELLETIMAIGSQMQQFISGNGQKLHSSNKP